MKLRKRNIERAAIRTRRWARARQEAYEMFATIESIIADALLNMSFEDYISCDSVISGVLHEKL